MKRGAYVPLKTKKFKFDDIDYLVPMGQKRGNLNKLKYPEKCEHPPKRMYPRFNNNENDHTL